jgi:hypothetical protein
MLSLDAIRSPGVCSRAMRAKLLVIISLALWAWVLPAAHAMPLDADGPSGLSDNADFDDLIVSITSPTAGVTAVLVQVAAPWSLAVDAVVLAPPGSVCSVVSSSVESRAPPLT